jgi:hypothetical protein
MIDAIGKVYGNRTCFNKSISLSATINLVIAEILYEDRQIDPTEMDLLIGSGGLYYYIVQVTESIEENSTIKRNLMGIVFLLADLINSSKESFSTMQDGYCQKWHMFNNSFGKDKLPLNDVGRNKTLPERYINIINNSKRPKIDNKITRIKPLRLK